MTREEYEAEVARPDKFECCAPYVPYFWGHQECADEDHGRYLKFTVSKEDVALFPELKEGDEIWLYESDGGFVYEVDEPTEEEIERYLDPDGWGGDDDSEEDEE